MERSLSLAAENLGGIRGAPRRNANMPSAGHVVHPHITVRALQKGGTQHFHKSIANLLRISSWGTI